MLIRQPYTIGGSGSSFIYAFAQKLGMSLGWVCLCVIVFFSLHSKAEPQGKYFDRVFTIVFENQAYETVMGDKFFSFYAKAGRLLSNYHALTHPSQPNYITMVGGSYFGISNDDNHDLPYSNLVDLMEKKEVSWKGYMQDFPGHCDPSINVGPYFRKHNPFISFNSVRTNATRCAKIVNADEFEKDLNAGTLHQYSFYTPNIDDDGHNTGLTYAGEFLHKFFSTRLSRFPKGTLIIITWDEDDDHHLNHIYTALLGSVVVPGSVDQTPYTHYSFLRTVEDNWSLGSLQRNDATATPFKF